MPEPTLVRFGPGRVGLNPVRGHTGTARVFMIKGINISTQWEISIDVKIEDVQPQWASVFQVSKGFTGTVGDRIPETV